MRDLLDEGVPGEVIRFVMLSTHYRKPMDWTDKKRAEADRVLRKWRSDISGVATADAPHTDVVAALADDLNTHQALQVLHKLDRAGDYAALKASAPLLGLLTDELDGWIAPSGPRGADHSRIEDLEHWIMAARNAAKLSGNYTDLLIA